MSAKAVLGRLCYGTLFCLVLPVLLVLWAIATRALVTLPAYGNQSLGAVLTLGGAGLMLWAIGALWFQGKGLPMNAFPPSKYVSTGVYELLPHPIYVGFTLVCLGISMMARSASGLWLVSPVVALGCAALVLGYEANDLERRFGNEVGGSWLPGNNADPPHPVDHVRFFLLVLLPWLALYEIVLSPGVPGNAIDSTFSFERRFPIWSWTEAVYASAYVVVLGASVLAATEQILRRLMIRVWLAMAIVFPLYLALPFVTPRKPFLASGLLGQLLDLERRSDPPIAGLPSFHIIWSILVAHAICAGHPRLRWPARIWAGTIAVACITTGMHSIVDVAAGVVFAGFLIRADRVWEWLRASSERLANSWQEWHFGPVRIINYGVYAGVSAFSAVAIVGIAAGPGHGTAMSLTALGALAGAALWAQWVEGSPQLLRPVGFYGGLFGVVITACLGVILGWDPWLLMAAYCLASPVLQSLGRLRCLVQGCCHGRPTVPHIGIRYHHPRSRVSRIAHLEGLPLHPTPLYSILWNGLVALVLTRLWLGAAPLHFIAALFLILTGLGRFVEEGYRGEPQTPMFAGLRLYQWIAISTVLAGAVISVVGQSVNAPPPILYRGALIPAIVFGLLAALALGVDFPESNRRFARLA